MRIEIDEAVLLIEKHVGKVLRNYDAAQAEEVSLEVSLKDSLGMILAEDIIANMNQPPFRRSTMDGYAICSEDYAKGAPIELQVMGTINAGDDYEYILREGRAVRIMTGGRVPEGGACVVPLEEVEPVAGAERIRIDAMPTRDNIAPIGEDYHKGDVLVPGRTMINAYAIAAAASMGLDKLPIYRKRKAAVISTGSELLPAGSGELGPGQIYDSNREFFSSRLREMGFEIKTAVTAADDEDAIKRAIRDAVATADILITTGGVSVGDKDLMEKIISDIGGRIIFHGINIKPGMPTMFSMAEGIPVLSLSGNPYSASAMFEYLFPRKGKILFNGFLVENYEKPRPVPRLVRGYWDGKSIHLRNNQLNGTVAEGVNTNCLALLPAGDNAIKDGSMVNCLLL